jgi:hypothetical protein
MNAKMQLSKLIFSTVLIIFNHIIFANCKSLFRGDELYSFFAKDKLYYFESIRSNFFYLDLAGASLDTDTVIDESKWVDLSEIKPQPEYLSKNLILDKTKDNFIILEHAVDDVNAYTFHTTLNQWEAEPVKVNKQKEYISFEDWVLDEKTGISYSFQSVFESMSVFDSNTLTLTKGVSTPENLFGNRYVFNDFVQILLNNQILFIGGGFESVKNSMNSILTYDILTDSWQMMVLI